MNILFLTTKLPYPPDSGGKIRDYNLFKEISKKHRVILLSFIEDEKERLNIEALEPLCKKIEVIREKNTSKLALFTMIFTNLFAEKPVTIAKYYSSEMQEKIRGIFSRDKIDLIHCSHLHMAQYVESIRNIPKVLDEHNVEFFLIKRYLKEQRNSIKKMLIFFLQYLKLERYESAIAQKFDHCLAVSDTDKKNLESIAPNAMVSIISNGVDIDFYEPQHTKAQPDTLVFTGAMDWFPNEDAMLYFFEKIWPLIKRDIKNVRFYIVGRNPSNKVLNLPRQETGIVVTGYVDDVRPYIARSSVYIVPLRIGGGSRLKILEAMAMGQAIVCTSIGCEGLEVTDDENILIADEPKEFAKKVVALLKDSGLRNKLGVNARRLVENKYSWDTIGKKLNEVYDKIVNLKEAKK